MNRSKHAFLIGGGPAGLVAAIALRRKGLGVTVADGGDAPSDKACGEGILPEGIAALERLGVSLDWSAGRTFRGIRFVKGDAVAQAQFGAASGLGMRRIELHRQLIRAAELSGVSILWRTAVTGIAENRVSASKEIFSADWIIGADGFHSQVRNWAGLESSKSPRVRFAFRQHFACTPWTNCVEVHWAENAQLYVTPVSENEIGVVVLSRNPKLRLRETLPLFPNIFARLAGCGATTTKRGAVAGNFVLPRVTSARVALIGDASGTVDAITGEGMSLAFLQAEALAEAIAHDDLARYEAAHARLRRRPIWMARALLAMENRSWAQERVVRIFASEPQLFQRMLSGHAGEASAFSLASAGARLGWRLLAA
jgi:flavin-dependent dehydrogenase